MEIKSGTLARRLLKPIHPLIAYSAENLASVPVRGLIAAPAALISLFTVGPEHLTHDPVVAAVFLLSLFGAWLITFFTMGIIGSVGFFIESSTSVFEIWFAAFMLLSGYIMPIELFPSWVRSLASYLPFRFTLGFPVEALIGLLDRRAALRELSIQWAFVAATGAGALVLFRAGTRRYSAYGG
jgi:ABC-2 type transport system permease protein